MPNIREEKPDSIPRFLEVIEEFQIECKESLWYRGCGKNSYCLCPSLYRHKKAKTPTQYAKLEQDLITRFRQRSIPYLTRDFTDYWTTLFFMQHYGIPTRLLDWSENPLIALHFALMDAPHEMNAKGDLKFKEDACVWILDPVKWNRHALSLQSYKGGALMIGDDALNGYQPTPAYSNMNTHPVALYGVHNSPRIVAQQGVFTIFGQVTTPMETTYIDHNFPEDCLIRIIIKSSVINSMRNSLLRHGITETVVDPGLEGLAREIKRSFSFEE